MATAVTVSVAATVALATALAVIATASDCDVLPRFWSGLSASFPVL